MQETLALKIERGKEGEEDMGALDKILHQAQTGGARVIRSSSVYFSELFFLI